MMVMPRRYEYRTSVLILIGKDLGVLIEIVPEIEHCDEIVLVRYRNDKLSGRRHTGTRSSLIRALGIS